MDRTDAVLQRIAETLSRMMIELSLIRMNLGNLCEKLEVERVDDFVVHDEEPNAPKV